MVKDVQKETKEAKENNKPAHTNISYFEAVGRRKESTARIRLYVVGESAMTVGGIELKKGSFIVNNRQAENYFPGEIYKKMYLEPFRTTNSMNRFATSIKTTGGGLSGQLTAVIHGISRALEKVDKEKYRLILKKRGFLTRDPRAKQRRKAGYAGKARARKQSPKR